MATSPTPYPYQTVLEPSQEANFQSWVKQNKVPWQDTPTADYDMRGYYKAMQSGDPLARQASNMHYPDTYKTPYHKTFSNESKYATQDAPSWQGNRLVDNRGNIVADENPIKISLPKGHQPLNLKPLTNFKQKGSAFYGD